jgi:hypothetical protein
MAYPWTIPTLIIPGWPTDHTKIANENIKAQSIVGGTEYSVQTIAGDILFYSTLNLQNIQPNSNYYVARTSSTNISIAGGTQGSTSADIILKIPAISISDNITIRVRGYGTNKYLPFETQAVLTRSGTTVYISQVVDAIGS